MLASQAAWTPAVVSSWQVHKYARAFCTYKKTDSLLWPLVNSTVAYMHRPSMRTAPVVDHDVCDDLDVVLVALVDQVAQVSLTAVAAVQLVQVTREVTLQQQEGT